MTRKTFPSLFLAALEEQDALLKEFRHQTARLGIDRQFEILASFCGNAGLRDCVELQQHQDGAPKPKHWKPKNAKG